MAVNRVDFGGNTLIDLTGDTLELPEQLLAGVTAHGRDGSQITGNIADNGDVSETMDGVTVKSVSIPSGRTSGGTIALDGTIDNATAAIASAIAGKGVTVPDGTMLDGMAALIEAIEAGGGSYVTGSFIYDSDV